MEMGVMEVLWLLAFQTDLLFLRIMENPPFSKTLFLHPKIKSFTHTNYPDPALLWLQCYFSP